MLLCPWQSPTTICRSTYCDIESWCHICELWQDDRQVCIKETRIVHVAVGQAPHIVPHLSVHPTKSPTLVDVVDFCASLNLRQRCYLTCVLMHSLRATTIYDMVESAVVSQSAITLYVDGVSKIISKNVSRSGFHKWSSNVPYYCHFTK